ncbi:hypothetical protein ACFP47_10285 [Nesterenkonia lacusekhoensis]|uniref:Zinc-ribbon domain-containing protein n=1 Tax=Nesterenkonia lacusekhoensis TaxID=150832 RepID=A0ABS4T554_9MICC|nr:hypothetical protein [Nesterenkonia lacusekhoensis]MBP2319589.1 hypothetical protein [Nesterenkonia lacusekhoensis]
MTTVHQDALFTVTLPDEPGMVHGIKSTDPWVIQCDGCGHILTKGDREPLVIFLGRIIFNPRVYQDDPRRMCADCWRNEGWEHTPHSGWQKT